MQNKLVTIYMHENLISAIDAECNKNGLTRAEYIRCVMLSKVDGADAEDLEAMIKTLEYRKTHPVRKRDKSK